MEKIIEKFRGDIRMACSQLSRLSFQQEPAYVAALMGKLAGMDVSLGHSRLQTSVVNDRGAGSAESEFGADFAIILESDRGVSKAILGQAKGVNIDKLPPLKKEDFFKQCEKMAKKTKHFIGLEVPMKSGALPTVRQGVWGPPVSILKQLALDDYLVDVFIACQHGDIRSNFVSAVKHSDLLQLRIMMAE